MKNNFKNLEQLVLEDHPMPAEEVRSSVLRTLDSFKFFASIVDFYTEKFSAAANEVITLSASRFYAYIYQGQFFAILRVKLQVPIETFDQQAFLDSIRLHLNNHKLVNVLQLTQEGLVLTLEMNKEEAERLFFLVKTGKLDNLQLEQIEYLGYYNARETAEEALVTDFQDLLIQLKQRIANLVKTGRIKQALTALEKRILPESDLHPTLHQLQVQYHPNQTPSPELAQNLLELTDRVAIHHLRF